MKKLLNI